MSSAWQRSSTARRNEGRAGKQRMKDINVVLELGTPEDLATFQKAEIEKWTRLAREAGTQPEG